MPQKSFAGFLLFFLTLDYTLQIDLVLELSCFYLLNEIMAILDGNPICF